MSKTIIFSGRSIAKQFNMGFDLCKEIVISVIDNEDYSDLLALELADTIKEAINEKEKELKCN